MQLKLSHPGVPSPLVYSRILAIHITQLLELALCVFVCDETTEQSWATICRRGQW